VFTHDKDLPTYWENCYYKGGSDDGVLETPAGNIGSILCWEFIRSQTAKRLLNNVKLVMSGSCWWTVPNEVAEDNLNRMANLKMLKEAAPNMAKMLGVPVIHGSHAGSFEGFFSPDLPDVPYNSVYLGEAMIVNAKGKVLASRSLADGAGVVTAMIDVPATSMPSEIIPERFWIPEEMPDEWKSSWERWFESGADYYQMVTENYLKTGEIIEYEPPYMR
jgi:predicted amidohydrolase